MGNLIGKSEPCPTIYPTKANHVKIDPFGVLLSD
jgi:hypothetical protein